MQSLTWHRYTAKEIAEYLIELGYKTPRGRDYYPQLVGATLSKLRSRKARTKEHPDFGVGSHILAKIS